MNMRRRYGQHFLKEPKILARIVEASGVGPGDAVLEIGPGAGHLTRALAARAGRVAAVEIDRRLFAALERAGLPANVILLRGDALALTGAEIVRALGPSYRLVANLPYEITAEALRKFLSGIDPRPVSITLLLQKEVGERLAPKPGDMNRLALFCGYYAEAERLFDVPRGALDPPPQVESCVVRLTLRPKPRLDPVSERRFFLLIEAAFREKRKQLKNSLSGLLPGDPAAAIRSAGAEPEARPEETSMDFWLRLAQGL